MRLTVHESIKLNKATYISSSVTGITTKTFILSFQLFANCIKIKQQKVIFLKQGTKLMFGSLQALQS